MSTADRFAGRDSRLAARAAERIGAGALNGGSVQDLAAELHIGARQLRRAVKREYGVPPVELAQTYRLLTAKRLLTETDLALIDVAYASGFASVRRFNALFRDRYDFTPRDFRRGSTAPRTAVRSTDSSSVSAPSSDSR